MPKKPHYKHTVYIRGEGYELLKNIVEKVPATKTDIIVLALKLLKAALEFGPGENLMYLIPNELWSELHEMHMKYHGWK